ncbi:MAG: iron-sulfur cluster assembly accessory protein [Cyclobacteriaceae bacterium]|nr:iron-sulfur cluster assembly accessory protein [Cyclobacteriaceae bacterium]
MHDFKPITISPKAVNEIKKIMDKKGIPSDYGLRIGVRGSGCGVSLMIGFDKKKETDLTYTINDIPVYVDKKHTMFLIGKEVDFYEGADGRGFTFIETPPRKH